MKKMSCSQFAQILDAGTVIGCIVDVNIETGKGEAVSVEELYRIIEKPVEIRICREEWFRTYTIYYRRKIEDRRVNVIISEEKGQV